MPWGAPLSPDRKGARRTIDRLAEDRLASYRIAADRLAAQNIPSTGCKVADTAGTFPAVELYNEIVTVQAGQAKKEFYLHRGLLCHYSTYFQGALRGDWKESKEGIITLDNEDEMTFQKFVDWLYTHRLPHVDLENRMTWLIQLWLLGDRRGVADLQNQAMDLLTQVTFADNPSPAAIKECYDATTTGSLLCQAIVDYFLVHTKISYLFSDDYETQHGEWPRNFCREFSIAADAKLPQLRADYNKLDKCKYHIH